MRKDVKFGLAVGSILLAVLVAYVLFVPPTNDTTVSLNTGDGGNRPTESNTNNQVVSVAPSGPATVPATLPAVTVTPTSDVWGSLLAQGPRTGGPVTGNDPFRDTHTVTPPVVNTGTGAVMPVITPATRPAPTAEREHIVQRGETLTSIATAAYGKPEYWPQIAKANPTVDAKHLKIGTKIILPKIEAEVPATPSSDVTPSPAGPHTGLLPAAAANTYTVKKGDTLYTISVARFGTAAKWDKIYELNKATIGADPARLKIGMVLKLPETPAAPVPPVSTTGR